MTIGSCRVSGSI